MATRYRLTRGKLWLGTGIGVITGWVITQQLWVLWHIWRRDVAQTLTTETNQAEPGLQFEQKTETDKFNRVHIVEDGLERISYFPQTRRFDTPLLFQHGMWHGAWCWQQWQELLAEWGWESHAHSLPGHAGSVPQRNIALCTLDYYLSFLKREVGRLPQKPVLIGHSMGGALTQWYLKYVSDLPAAILVAPWTSHSIFRFGASLPAMVRLDPVGCLLTFFKWRAMFGAHDPQSAAKLLISARAIVSPEELYAKLGPESVLVLYQHNPPFWFPPDNVTTPMLWLAGEIDAGIPEATQRQSAAHYRADYVVIEGAGHNLMMEHNYHQTAEIINQWLVKQGIG